MWWSFSRLSSLGIPSSCAMGFSGHSTLHCHRYFQWDAASPLQNPWAKEFPYLPKGALSLCGEQQKILAEGWGVNLVVAGGDDVGYSACQVARLLGRYCLD